MGSTDTKRETSADTELKSCDINSASASASFSEGGQYARAPGVPDATAAVDAEEAKANVVSLKEEPRPHLLGAIIFIQGVPGR